jgi:orotidine-5'-phosphate decarboxylase
LDFPDAESAMNLVSRLSPDLCHLKVGHILFTRYGLSFVENLTRAGFSVFLDLKFHDIPHTVSEACRAAAGSGVWMLNVHIQGGSAMLEAAVNELSKLPEKTRPLLTGVTVLTSLTDADLKSVGLLDNVEDTVLRMARLGQASGLDGVVCSPHEVQVLRKSLGEKFILVTPGIRLLNDANEDQQRVMTPSEAISAGSNYIVMGRSILNAKDPIQLIHKLFQ